MIRNFGFTAVFACVLAFLSMHCMAEGKNDYSGAWAMQLDGHNLLVLEISQTGDQVHGTVESPSSFKMTNAVFSVSPGPAKHGTLEGRITGSALHVTLRKSADAPDATSFVMSLIGSGAELVPAGLPPWNAVQALAIGACVQGCQGLYKLEPGPRLHI